MGVDGGAWRADLDVYVALARFGLERFVRSGRPAQLEDVPVELPAELTGRRAGAFVSLHRADGSLRGCIGTVEATQDCLAREILANAVSACSRDPRFAPVGPAELAGIACSVDVLGPAQACTRDDLDPRRFGVIVAAGWRRGLLLPALEGVETVGEQIDIARRKAGIGPGEPFTLERFEVVRHEQ